MNSTTIYMQCIVFLLLLAGCKQESIDKDTKRELAMKAKTELNYAGLQYTVTDGVITLSGNCPTQKAKDEVLKTINDMPGIKQVIDHIQVAPVVINTDYTLKLAVDSILAEYPGVMAQVQDSSVTLLGTVKGKQLQNMLIGVEELHPKQITKQLTVEESQ